MDRQNDHGVKGLPQNLHFSSEEIFNNLVLSTLNEMVLIFHGNI